jgi:MSHA pilin protein MshD
MCIDSAAWVAPRVLRPQRGVSLVELIIFIVVVGTALAGVVSMLNIGVAHSADPMIQKQMQTIAEGLLDEIDQMPFSACDPVSNTNPSASTTTQCSPATSWQQLGYPLAGASPRSSFNNLGNYCGNVGPNAATCSALTLGSSSTAMPDLTGSSAGSPVGYWATVTLTPEALWGISSSSTAATAAAAAAMNALRVTVVVHFGNDSLTMETYRTRWSPAPMIQP